MPGLVGFDAIWTGSPEDADVVGGQLKERALIEPLVTSGERIYARYSPHSLVLDRLYLNRDNFAAAYRLPMRLDSIGEGIIVYLTDRQILIIFYRDAMFGRLKVRAAGYSYKKLHYTGYSIDHSNPSLPWLSLFVGEDRYTDYVFIIRFRTREPRDRFTRQLSELHAATTDPDLAQLHRGIAAGDAQPPGEVGKTLTPAQVIDESRRLRQQVASGDLRSAWDRRVQLGYGVPSDGVPQADRFWLDAAPALAALRLGELKDHPMVPMCCGMAEQGHNRQDPEQRDTVEEINRLFFGEGGLN